MSCSTIWATVAKWKYEKYYTTIKAKKSIKQKGGLNEKQKGLADEGLKKLQGEGF